MLRILVERPGPELVDVAMGRAPADTVIRNGKWVNVYSGEIVPHTDVAIDEGRFAYAGPTAAIPSVNAPR